MKLKNFGTSDRSEDGQSFPMNSAFGTFETPKCTQPQTRMVLAERMLFCVRKNNVKSASQQETKKVLYATTARQIKLYETICRNSDRASNHCLRILSIFVHFLSELLGASIKAYR